MMEMDLGLAVSAGVDGLVFGCCKPFAGGWALDELTLGALVMAAGCATEECKREPIDITFHMAFDQLSPEAQLDAIDTLADCGVTRILTHGGAAGTSIEDNFDHLTRLIEYAGDRLTILPGGGITTANRDAVSPTIIVALAPRAPFATRRGLPTSSSAMVTASGSRISSRHCGPHVRPY